MSVFAVVVCAFSVSSSVFGVVSCFLMVFGGSGKLSGALEGCIWPGASEALWCFLWVSMAHCACTALLLSGAFLRLLLLLCLLLLLLVLLPLVGTFGTLQLHASTTFNNVRASRSLLRQVLMDSDGF